jgi:short-subunit dehydrogenase
VVICARDRTTLAHAREKLAQQGVPVLAVPCDVTRPAEIEKLLRVVRERAGRIDVVVNNAGMIAVGPLKVMTLADYEEAMRLHFWAPLYMTLAVVPEMSRRGEGRIVNIASFGGKLSVPHLVPYSASKFALVGLSHGFRAELAKEGIVVTTVCPGLMRTGSPPHATFKGQHRAEYAWFSVSAALPFLSMSAERAARQIVAACKRGEAEVVLSLPAQLAATFGGLFPEITADILRTVNDLLPTGDRGDGTPTKGSQSTSWMSPSWVTALNERAARELNQVA